ncbi:hypothetical protein GCM10010343_15250 [Streptomyces avidinii]|uniref:Uncharacterized protein n=1 Tax=Streptomyces avidinii TaxID=1895 RepID=A0ABS4KYC2_STRAV|nr:hypothetical protein [Streptomyces avidinii]GGY90722.1 hypothetical protein GCM10010343_15250 [Streptomyces avidinii]
MGELGGQDLFERGAAVRPEGADVAVTRADGKRQMAVAVNLQRWNRLDPSGRPQPHPIDDALATFYRVAMYG